MKTENSVPAVPFSGRKQSLIEDARRERSSNAGGGGPSVGSPGPSKNGDGFVFEEKHGMTFEAKLLHIESRPGRKWKNSSADLEFFMRCEVHSSDLDVFINALKRVADEVRSIPEEKVPWFPRQIKDLDRCNLLNTKFDPDMDQDHPGFSDSDYRRRRTLISELAVS